jgi:hypothetical protein
MPLNVQPPKMLVLSSCRFGFTRPAASVTAALMLLMM